MLTINDDAFPINPQTFPEHNDLQDGDIYRLPNVEDYYRRVSGSSSYSFASNSIVTISDPHMSVQPVTAELVITAP